MKCYCGNVIKNMYPGRKYCSMTCRSGDKEYRTNISNKKRLLYSDPTWKNITEEKKTSTTFINYGVKYPMQNLDIFERQQKACFDKDKNGLHGYEPYAYGFLKQLYADLENGTSYLRRSDNKIRWVGSDNKEHRSYPDFYSDELKSFIEVKGEYTRKLHTYKLNMCKNALYNMGFGYIICVVNPNKSLQFETYNEEHINVI